MKNTILLLAILCLFHIAPAQAGEVVVDTEYSSELKPKLVNSNQASNQAKESKRKKKGVKR